MPLSSAPSLRAVSTSSSCGRGSGVGKHLVSVTAQGFALTSLSCSSITRCSPKIAAVWIERGLRGMKVSGSLPWNLLFCWAEASKAESAEPVLLYP